MKQFFNRLLEMELFHCGQQIRLKIDTLHWIRYDTYHQLQ